MKHINELTQSELLDLIFIPIFGMSIKSFDGWENLNYKEILDDKKYPTVFNYEIHDNIRKEILAEELRMKTEEPSTYYPDSVRYNIDIRNKTIMKHGLVRQFSYPIFEVTELPKCITINLKAIKCINVHSEKYETSHNEYNLTIFDNGDITQNGCYLSYTQTIKMREYFNSINVNINKELNYQI